MNKLVLVVFKCLKCSFRHSRFWFCTLFGRIIFWLNGASVGKGFRAIGYSSVNISLGGICRIGHHVVLRTGCGTTEIGCIGSRIRVGPNGKLHIGDYVGMSNVSIVCDQFISIGNHVNLGGGVQIFDTNFHSTDAAIRCSGHEKRSDVRTAPVKISDYVFIGTNALICKGVSIGEKAVVAAGSVVVCSIPAGEVWGGNPARKIR